ncbi:hypothetical protein RGU75_20770 [Glaciimonas sp. CA11.2]|nr:hypothetical protein [Glaciimonas sp. CA11.2]MDY7548654.1 hypothetical protein [Glaciimonas sp. CA11.2]
MSGHDAPEWSVTIDQNRWSRSARIPTTSLPLLPTQDNRQQWVQFE